MKRKFLAVLLAAILAGTSAAPVYSADFSSGEETGSITGTQDFSMDAEGAASSGTVGAAFGDGMAETAADGEEPETQITAGNTAAAGASDAAQDETSWKNIPEDTAGIQPLEEGREYEVETTEEAKAVWLSFTPEKTGLYTLRVSVNQEEKTEIQKEVQAALFLAEELQEPAAEYDASKDSLCETLTAEETCYFCIYLTEEGSDGENEISGSFHVCITEGSQEDSQDSFREDSQDSAQEDSKDSTQEDSQESPQNDTEVYKDEEENPAGDDLIGEALENTDSQEPAEDTESSAGLQDDGIKEAEAGFLLGDGETSEAPDFSDNRMDTLKRGASLTYSYDSLTQTLTIKGSGQMSDYDGSTRPPWNAYASTAQNLILESGITSVGETAFYEFTALTSVTLPATITEIGVAAFADTDNLSQVNIPEGVTKIDAYAFQYSALTSIELPASLTSLGSQVFVGCDSLKEISVASENTVYTSADGVVFNKNKTILHTYPAGKTDSSYTIPSTVKMLNDYSFQGTCVQNVKIPASVTTLGEGVFNMSEITSLVLPDSVTSIGNFLCEECESLETVKIGTGLTALSYGAFRECKNLVALSLGSNLTDLGYLTFADCSSLTTVAIPEKITYIPNGCFGDCTALTTINFPSNLTEIWFQAFFGCSSLKTVTLPNKIRQINRLAFYGTGITRVTLPESLFYVAENAFPNGTEFITASGNLQQQENGSYLEVYALPLEVTYDYTSAFQVLQLVNEQREAQGLSELKMDQDLLSAAMHRAAENAVYFSHTRPNGLDCNTICSSKMYGENIAVGQGSASSVMDSWMNSSGHRGNILGSSYNCIGVGAVIVNGMRYWVQCFGICTPVSVSASQYSNQTSTTEVSVIAPENYSGDDAFYTISASGTSPLAYGKTGGVKMYVNNTWVNTPVSADFLNYKSSDTSVCTVSSTGVLRAKGSGTAKITVSLKSGSKIKASANVTVTGLYSMSNCTVKLSASSLTCTGSARCPSVTVKYGSTTLVKNADYTLSAVNNVNPGTATLTIKGKGKYYGTITKSFKIVMKAPELLKAASAGYNKVTVSWKAVPGAQSYTLYYKGGSVTNWKSVKSGITGTSYTHTSSSTRPLQSGTTYTYTVRAVYGSTKSSYDTAGKTVVPVPAAPKLTGITSPSYNKLQITWDKVSGATGYYIYRKIDGKWKAIAKTTDTSYTHRNSTKYPIVTGTTYTYTVRAYRMVGTKKVLGGYDKTGIKGKAVLPAPVLNDLSAATDGLTLTWNSVSGASGYKIYRYNYETEAWTRIGATKNRTYTDKTTPAGAVASYKIRAYRTIGENNIHSAYSEIKEGIWGEAIPDIRFD